MLIRTHIKCLLIGYNTVGALFGELGGVGVVGQFLAIKKVLGRALFGLNLFETSSGTNMGWY